MSGFNPGNSNNGNNSGNSNSAQPQQNNDPITTPPSGSSNLLRGTAFFSVDSASPTSLVAKEIVKLGNFNSVDSPIEVLDLPAAVGLRMGTVAICYKYRSAKHGKNLYVVDLIFLEDTLASSVRNPLKTDPITNQQYNLVVTPDDFITTDFLNSAATAVRARVTEQNYEVIIAGFRILNKNIQPEALPQILAGLTRQAGESIAQYIEFTLQEEVRQRDSIAEIIQGRTLAIDYDTSGQQVFNSRNQPVRADFTATISATVGSANTDFFDSNTTPLTTTAGYLDVTYYKLSDQEVFQARMTGIQGQEQAQRFEATAVITDIQSRRDIFDVDSIVNAILSMARLSENRQWVMLLRKTNSNSSAARMRDVGYLALEVDPANGVFDTNSADFTDQSFFTLMNALFRNNLGVAIELPRVSEYGLFRQLIRSSVDRGSNGYRAFVKAIHDYTNGHFPIDYNGDIVSIDNRPVLLGSYSSGSGVGGSTRHDIRDYQDYLTAITQLGRSDMAMVQDYDTLTAGLNGESLDYRTSKAYQFVSRIGGEVTLTGKADRYNFNNQFINDLVVACGKANLNIQLQGSLGVMNQVATNRRSGSGLAGQAQLNVGGIFSSSNNNVGGGTGFGQAGGTSLNFGL